MRKRVVLLLVFAFLITNVYASCDTNQININTASLEELDKLSGIGPAKAQAIVDARPFDSVDDLVDVYGIGEVTLDKIKEQGLACVDGSDEEEDSQDNEEDEDLSEEETDDEDNDDKETRDKEESIEVVYITENKTATQTEQKIEKDAIVLGPKDIKTEIDKNEGSKRNYSVIGLIFFCFLLGVLYLIKERRYRKNEFKE